VLVAAASTVVLLATGTAWRTLDAVNSGLATTGALAFGPSLSGDSGAPADGATDILLVGTDSRTDAQGKALTTGELAMLRAGEVAATNTDTIVLVRIPNDGRSASAVSIPRDSYVAVPGQGMEKINGAYGISRERERIRLVQRGVPSAEAEARSAEAARSTLISAVQDLTGVSIDHYAEIGLLGFTLLTDAVGGVQVCLLAPAREPLSGANFAAGVQTLRGPDALSFVRQRHNLPRGDLDRIRRQQVFMASLARTVLSAGTLTNPGTLSRLTAAVQRSVVIDSGWDIAGFATQMASLAGGAVTFRTIPVANPDATTAAGVSIVEVNPDEVRRFVVELVTGAPAVPPTSTSTAPPAVTVDVANASGTAGLAARVSAALAVAGYRPGLIGNAGGAERSVVLAPSASDGGGAAVAAQLGGLTVRQDTSVRAGSVRVVLATDYAGPGSGGPAPAGPAPVSPAPVSPAPASAPDPGPAPVAAAGGPPCVS
jgi:LCP family protein required for cell wall assembly